MVIHEACLFRLGNSPCHAECAKFCKSLQPVFDIRRIQLLFKRFSEHYSRSLPSFQHFLTACDGQSLTCFIFLLNYIEERTRNILRQTAAIQRNLALVIAAHIVHRLCTGNLAGVQILNEKSSDGV